MMKMRKKISFLCFVIGLLMASVVIPSSTAYLKPSQALNQGEVPGWWCYNEGAVGNILWSGYNLTMWWQIWINNQTAQENATEAWANATKAICATLIAFPDEINDEWWFALKTWFQIINGTDQDIDGLENAIIWKENGRYLGLASNDEFFILMMGYNETSAPENPFSRWWQVKTPINNSTGAADLALLLISQGEKIDQIPGFELTAVLIILVLISCAIVLYHKDQFKSHIFFGNRKEVVKNE
jgi:hypothetical protein